MNKLPNEIIDNIYDSLHHQYMKDLSKEIKSKIIKSEVYQLSIKRMMTRVDRSWKLNKYFTVDDHICDLWNWQKYMQKAIHKYYIKILGYQQYSVNKIKNSCVGYLEGFDLLEELNDGLLSLDTLLDESLCENSENYDISHKYEFTNQLRMLSELCLLEFHNS